MAKLIQVIETEVTRGNGREDNPSRTVVQWWTPDGVKLAERDSWALQEVSDATLGVPLVVDASGVTVSLPMTVLRALVQ